MRARKVLLGVASLAVSLGIAKGALAPPVQITELQARIFLDEAAELERYHEGTKRHLEELEKSAGTLPKRVDVLLNVTRRGYASVGKIKEAFRASDPTPTQLDASGAMFADITRHYEALPLREIEAAGYAGVQDRTLRTMENQYLAYAGAGMTQSLTFDLRIKSSPSGANVSYRRIGDRFQDHRDPTETIVEGLVYAIWLIRLEKQGYIAVEKEFDPFREKIKALHVDLVKQ